MIKHPGVPWLEAESAEEARQAIRDAIGRDTVEPCGECGKPKRFGYRCGSCGFSEIVFFGPGHAAEFAEMTGGARP